MDMSILPKERTSKHQMPNMLKKNGKITLKLGIKYLNMENLEIKKGKVNFLKQENYISKLMIFWGSIVS